MRFVQAPTFVLLQHKMRSFCRVNLSKFKPPLQRGPNLRWTLHHPVQNLILERLTSFPVADTRQSLEAHFRPLSNRKLHEIAAYLNLLPPPGAESGGDGDKENGMETQENGDAQKVGLLRRTASPYVLHRDQAARATFGGGSVWRRMFVDRETESHSLFHCQFILFRSWGLVVLVKTSGASAVW